METTFYMVHDFAENQNIDQIYLSTDSKKLMR